MGRTLFEILSAKWNPAEEKVCNPLKMRIGTAVNIRTIDLKDFSFNCIAIQEYNRIISGKNYQFTDYDLFARPYNKDLVKVKLRLTPLDNPDQNSGLTHNILVLNHYYDCSYKDAKETGLTESVGENEFKIDWNDESRTYWRVNDLTTPYNASVKRLKDSDGNGRVDVDEVENFDISYWDYHTELVDEAGYKYVEYLFIEKNKQTGWFEIWNGSEIIPEKVVVV